MEAYNKIYCNLTHIFYLKEELHEEKLKAENLNKYRLRQINIKHQQGPNWGQESFLDSLTRKYYDSVEKINSLELQIKELLDS